MATPEIPEGGRTPDPPINIVLSGDQDPQKIAEQVRRELDRPGPDHRADPGTGKPNAFWRTVLQVGPAAALSLLLILPQVLQTILDQYGEQLPPGLYTALISITATVTLVAAIAAKVMSMPAVQVWLARYAPFFAATKK